MDTGLSLHTNFPQSLRKESAFADEYRAISRETDRDSRYAGYLNLAHGVQAAGKLEAAVELYRGILADPEATDAMRRQARRELEALQGTGSLGGRVEVLLKSTLHSAADPSMILPMMGASIVGQCVKAVGLARILAMPAGIATRGAAARFAAGTLGFGAEGLVFAGLGRGMRQAPEGTWGQELARSYVGLGALHFSGWLGRRVAGSLAPAGGGVAVLSRAAVPQLALFAGLSLAHRAEIQMGLRTEFAGDHWIADTLAAMLSLQVGIKLGHSVLGERYRQFSRALAMAGEGESRVLVWQTAGGLRLDGPMYMVGGNEGDGKRFGGGVGLRASESGAPTEPEVAFRVRVSKRIGLTGAQVFQTYLSTKAIDLNSPETVAATTRLHRALEEVLVFGSERSVPLKGETAQRLRAFVNGNRGFILGLTQAFYSLEVQFNLDTEEMAAYVVGRRDGGIPEPLPSTQDAPSPWRSDSVERLVENILWQQQGPLTGEALYRGLQRRERTVKLTELTRILEQMVDSGRLILERSGDWNMFSLPPHVDVLADTLSEPQVVLPSRGAAQSPLADSSLWLTPLPPPVALASRVDLEGPQTGEEFRIAGDDSPSPPASDTEPLSTPEGTPTDRIGEDSTLKSATVEPIDK